MLEIKNKLKKSVCLRTRNKFSTFPKHRFLAEGTAQGYQKKKQKKKRKEKKKRKKKQYPQTTFSSFFSWILNIFFHHLSYGFGFILLQWHYFICNNRKGIACMKFQIVGFSSLWGGSWGDSFHFHFLKRTDLDSVCVCAYFIQP